METPNILSDDDYDVISNPGTQSLESSIEDIRFQIHEPPASEDAQELFETIRWSASDIQLYVRKGLKLASPEDDGIHSTFVRRRVKVYVEGIFDPFETRHALKLRQAKLAFPSVHLIVGVFSDEVLRQNNLCAQRSSVERAELVRHCRWIDEVIKDAPWVLTSQFLKDKAIDFVAVEEGVSIDPSFDKARVKAYDELKNHGKVIRTRRILGNQGSQTGCAHANVSSGRATPTLSSSRPGTTSEYTGHVDIYGIGF